MEFNKRHLAAEFYFHFQLCHPLPFEDLRMCHHAISVAELYDLTIFPHTHRVPRIIHESRYFHQTGLFRFPKKSSSSKWWRSEHEWYRNLGQNLRLIAPLVKAGRVGEFLLIFTEEFEGPCLQYENNGRPGGRSPSTSSNGKKIINKYSIQAKYKALLLTA